MTSLAVSDGARPKPWEKFCPCARNLRSSLNPFFFRILIRPAIILNMKCFNGEYYGESEPILKPILKISMKKKNTMQKKKCDINIARAIELSKKMIKLAQSGYEEREDPGCGVLYGILL